MIFVSGLGRCGTSLVMQMLHAGGVHCLGPWPSYEIDDVLNARTEWWARQPQWAALKLIDPHKFPDSWYRDGVVIFLTRDHTTQARSQLKFLAAAMGERARGLFDLSSDMVQTWRESLDRELPIARDVVSQRLKRPTLELRFEDVIAEPQRAADALCGFLSTSTPWKGLDRDAMASVCLQRDASVQAPRIELELLKTGKPPAIKRRTGAGRREHAPTPND